MKTLLPSAALLILVGAISADDHAPLKEGLWAIHTQFTEYPSENKNDTDTFYCRDRAHDDREKAAMKQGANCWTVSEATSDRTHTRETACKQADTVITTKMALTIISDSSTHTETMTPFNPPSAGRTGNTILTDQKYVGACPAGVVSNNRICLKVPG